MTDATKSTLKDIGLLVMRVGFGLMFVLIHGWPKMSGGVSEWASKGAAMGHLGVHFWPAFWGFMAAFSELVGGICIVLGLFFRPMAALLAFTMFVAAFMHFKTGGGLDAASHAIECFAVALGFVWTGPGRFSVGNLLFGGKASKKKSA